MPNASNAIAIKHAEFGLQLSTAMLITFAVGLVLLQLSVRFGMLVHSFDAPTF
jgi:uncharacterized membrane protein YGL010W